MEELLNKFGRKFELYYKFIEMRKDSRSKNIMLDGEDDRDKFDKVYNDLGFLFMLNTNIELKIVLSLDSLVTLNCINPKTLRLDKNIDNQCEYLNKQFIQKPENFHNLKVLYRLRYILLANYIAFMRRLGIKEINRDHVTKLVHNSTNGPLYQPDELVYLIAQCLGVIIPVLDHPDIADDSLYLFSKILPLLDPKFDLMLIKQFYSIFIDPTTLMHGAHVDLLIKSFTDKYNDDV